MHTQAAPTDVDRPRGRSPQRQVRIPDDVWYAAVARAKRQDRPIGHVVTDMLRQYGQDQT